MKKQDALNGERVVKEFTKIVTPSGSSGHIAVGKEFVGDVAHVVIKKKWMICKRCSDTFLDKKSFSPDPRYCRYCFEGLKRLAELKKNNNLKCKKCGKKITESEYKLAWDVAICPRCWEEEAEKESQEYESTGINKWAEDELED